MLDGFEIIKTEYVDAEGKIWEVLHQQLHVGYAYSVPELFEGWRYCNSEVHALEKAKLDIDSFDTHGHKELHHRTNPRRDGSPEHMFSIRQHIEALEAELEALKKCKVTS